MDWAPALRVLQKQFIIIWRLDGLRISAIRKGIKMSIEAQAWATDQPTPPIPKLILLLLADQADSDGVAVVDIELIKRRSGMTANEIKAAYADLERLLLIRPALDLFREPGYKLLMPDDDEVLP